MVILISHFHNRWQHWHEHNTYLYIKNDYLSRLVNIVNGCCMPSDISLLTDDREFLLIQIQRLGVSDYFTYWCLSCMTTLVKQRSVYICVCTFYYCFLITANLLGHHYFIYNIINHVASVTDIYRDIFKRERKNNNAYVFITYMFRPCNIQNQLA